MIFLYNSLMYKFTVLFEKFSIKKCTHEHNRDSSVNRPILNCIMIADNKFKNRVHFTAYAVCI